MLSTHKSSFGPYYVQNTIAASDVSELSLAALFGPDGTKPMTVLRRLRNPSTVLAREFIDCASRYAVLRHPNIAEVKDLGTWEGQSYLATEFVRGKSLLSALAACGRLGLGFPTDVALSLTIKILEAVHHAHTLKARDGRPLGILHRDLRHSNVLLGMDGTVKVSDFEISFASTHAKTPRGVCIGGRQGFFSYLSPEQAREEMIDVRSDVFAIGVLLYELVTGRHLFSDKTEERLLTRLAQGQFDLPIARYRPDLHPELGSIIRTALAHEPSDRWSSAMSFLDALLEFLSSVGVTSSPAGLRELMVRLFGPDEEE